MTLYFSVHQDRLCGGVTRDFFFVERDSLIALSKHRAMHRMRTAFLLLTGTEWPDNSMYLMGE